MKRSQIIRKVDDYLRPHNFIRRNVVWNRRSQKTVEVIDIQVSKAGDSVTVNAGVLDPEVYKTLWDKEPPALIQEVEGTVRARIGDLVETLAYTDHKFGNS